MKSVSILSGGMDSIVATAHMMTTTSVVGAVCFDYLQRHKNEILCAKKFCEKNGIKLKIIDASFTEEIFKGSGLTDGQECEEGTLFEKKKSSFIPNRNMIFCSIAVAYALSIEADLVFSGEHQQEQRLSAPDATVRFTEAMSKAVEFCSTSTGPGLISLVHPLIEMNLEKHEVALLGEKLGISHHEHWSCHLGKEFQCGSCSKCISRKQIYSDIGVTDQTVYEG